MKQSWLFLFFLVLVLGSGLVRPTAVVGQQQEQATPFWQPPQQPTEVYFDIIIIDIPAINEREETFTIEGAMYLEWLDPRLAFDPAIVGADIKIFHDAEATNQLNTTMWNPVVEFENSRGQRRTSNRSLIIEADGLVGYEERFNLTLATKMDLREFPFDTQEFTISVSSFLFVADEMVLSPDSVISIRPGFQMNEWYIIGEPTTEIRERGMYGIVYETTDAQQYVLSYGHFTITLERNAGFYIWKLLVPLLIITTASWVGFWRKPSVAPRVNMTFSSMLTVVAYNFVVGNSLPRIAYLTRLDTIFILTYAFIALAVVESIVASYWDDHGRGEAALRLDRYARVLFPLTYLGIYAFLLFF